MQHIKTGIAFRIFSSDRDKEYLAYDTFSSEIKFDPKLLAADSECQKKPYFYAVSIAGQVLNLQIFFINLL